MPRRRSKALDKELTDNSYLLRQWHAWHREQLEDALAGVHRDVLERLLQELTNLRSARKLIQFIAAQDWSALDFKTRFVALHEVNEAITKLRISLGLAPFDDGLPGEQENTFQTIQKIIAS